MMKTIMTNAINVAGINASPKNDTSIGGVPCSVSMALTPPDTTGIASIKPIIKGRARPIVVMIPSMVIPKAMNFPQTG